MADNKKPCPIGKTIIVDPNDFDGHDSSSNVSVPLEDLSIYVQLETTKKARTYLNSTGNSGMVKDVDKLSVTFIEGTKINGVSEKVLTTSYTDLTTNLNDKTQDEALGITSIDIDFNSSIAPMVVIDFIDVRGSSIFQNENRNSDLKNKYSVFFELPYPIFTLTVKGYYGMAVKYDLHMTKFNAKFNSTTGNFEIRANFVGYTYAMLSDVLIGYLRAIPYTKLGASLYKDLKLKNENIITLDELVVKISAIDEQINKLKDTDEVKGLSTIEEKLNILNNIKLAFKTLGQKLSINDKLSEYRYIVSKSIPQDTTNNSPYIASTENKNTAAFNEYNENVKEQVKLFNENPIGNVKIDEKSLTSESIIFSKDFSFSTNTSFLPYELSEIQNYIINNNVTNETQIDIYSLSNQYNLINLKENELNATYENSKINVAKDLRLKVEKDLNFKPTLRNIINVFSTAFDVYMRVLFDISNKALNNADRKSELQKIFKPEENKDINLNYKIKDENFYPWPEYRSGDTNDNLTEAYLGTDVKITPSKITELNFIDELLQAFIISKQKIDDLLITEEKRNNTWIPANPLDTKLFIDTYPYDRINGNTASDVIAQLMERAFIYIGFSNFKLTEKEIRDFCDSECQSILRDIKNSSILQNISQNSKTSSENSKTSDDFYYKVKAINHGMSVPIMRKLGSDYYYSFIFYESVNTASETDASYKKLLPITVPPKKDFSFDFTNFTTDLLEFSDTKNYKFLTNYASSRPPSASGADSKPYDGGIYVKFISTDDYTQPTYEIERGQELSPIIFASLNENKQYEFNELQPNEIGFTQFGGAHGIQEYKRINFGQDKLEDAEYRLLFYKDSIANPFGGSLNSSLTNKRGAGKTTPYDVNSISCKIFEDIEDAIIYTTGDEEKRTHDIIGNNRLLLNNYIKNKDNNISYPFAHFNILYFNQSIPIGLFASRLYNEQNGTYGDYVKAFLFLHTLPWNGLISNQLGVFNTNEIINTFGNRAGFISVPKLWAAFIGGLLWRNDNNQTQYYQGTDIIQSGGAGYDDPIKWYDNNGSFIAKFADRYPNRNQYLKTDFNINLDKDESSSTPMSFNYDKPAATFIYLDNVLLQLPEQVKNEFKSVFFEFVKKSNGSLSDWDILKSELEVHDSNSTTTWVQKWDKVMEKKAAGGGKISDSELDINVMKSQYSKKNIDGKLVFDNYIIFSPYDSSYDLDYNYVTELRDNSAGVSSILKLLSEEVYLMNTTWRIWQKGDEDGKGGADDEDNVKTQSGIKINQDNLKIFIDQARINFNPDNTNPSEKEKQDKQAIFGTDNDNIIKFQLYKTSENIYNKWIGGNSEYSNIFNTRSNQDYELAKKRNGQLGLIDSFRFVDRSFTDIGDTLYINPTPVSDFLKNNIDYSFYNVVTKLLSSNNLDFIALPTYINYNNPDELSKMFKPIPTVDYFSSGVTGPSFVCIYVGQTSKYLDFNSLAYPNDGVDFRCPTGKEMVNKPLPSDFTKEVGEGENNVAVFTVNYGQQNQNIFKDIILDQSEFAETDESLRITDDIANRGSENRSTFNGQNIFNVFSVRSYKAEVEMMGNAMVQPMMHFQLNNIPMFHGGYLITHVKHSIKPNSMSTNFSGVRIRSIQTPIIDSYQMYMSLLDSIKLGLSNSSNGIDSQKRLNAVKDAQSTPCNIVVKDSNFSFDDVLKLVVDNLEGCYYNGNLNSINESARASYENSGETLWGLDRKRNKDKEMPILEKQFWGLVDKKNKSKWNLFKYPKPSDEPDLYTLYAKILKTDYDNFKKTALKYEPKSDNINTKLFELIESDPRLYFNMIYAVYNGSGWFAGFFLLLKASFTPGKTTSDELLTNFVNERIMGGYNAYSLGTGGGNLGSGSAELIMKTGYKIEKMVGLSKDCIG